MSNHLLLKYCKSNELSAVWKCTQMNHLRKYLHGFPFSRCFLLCFVLILCQLWHTNLSLNYMLCILCQNCFWREQFSASSWNTSNYRLQLTEKRNTFSVDSECLCNFPYEFWESRSVHRVGARGIKCRNLAVSYFTPSNADFNSLLLHRFYRKLFKFPVFCTEPPLFCLCMRQCRVVCPSHL